MPSWHFSTSPSAEPSSARLAKQRLTSLFCHRLRAMPQPVEFFNRLLGEDWRMAVDADGPPAMRVGGSRACRVVRWLIQCGEFEFAGQLIPYRPSRMTAPCSFPWMASTALAKARSLHFAKPGYVGSGMMSLPAATRGARRLGESIRNILLDSRETKILRTAEMLLYMAARAAGRRSDPPGPRIGQDGPGRSVLAGERRLPGARRRARRRGTLAHRSHGHRWLATKPDRRARYVAGSRALAA